MSDPSSELVEISKLNGDLKRNYGRLIGAYLYLRSVSAARGRSGVLGRPSVHAHFCKRDLAEEAWLTLIVSGTRGCEFWADDVAFATQARSPARSVLCVHRRHASSDSAVRLDRRIWIANPAP